ncbi:hypothetical protein AAEO57_03805 [Flavobacterium sp. DGU38]|uniref:Uncharacterized protein n=1 Tax=Flavobacterium calami TaxID=3139144 RepID=A0ABU9IKC1_9FLAO
MQTLSFFPYNSETTLQINWSYTIVISANNTDFFSSIIKIMPTRNRIDMPYFSNSHEPHYNSG